MLTLRTAAVTTGMEITGSFATMGTEHLYFTTRYGAARRHRPDSPFLFTEDGRALKLGIHHELITILIQNRSQFHKPPHSIRIRVVSSLDKLITVHQPLIQLSRIVQ